MSIFVSHANPEDNDIARWLTLQLAKNGYRVWCDLTQLLGGEDFWSDIELTLRENTNKFLFILSRTSNTKQGTLQELHLADVVAKKRGIKDFIIPLIIDNLPSNEFNIQLSRRNAIKFNESWADGLSVLLDKLNKDSVEKIPSFGPGNVAHWWKTQYANDCHIVNKVDKHLSNLFAIKKIPNSLFIHELKDTFQNVFGPFLYPCRRYKQYLISFALKENLKKDFSLAKIVSETVELSYDDFIKGNNGLNLPENTARSIMTDLLRQAWEFSIEDFKLSKHLMGRKSVTGYFKNNVIRSNRLKLSGIYEKDVMRGIVGFGTRKDWEGNILGKRYWHYAVQFRPSFVPVFSYIAISHVLFSYDGEHILPNTKTLHRLRRSTCKDWWNPEWRDKVFSMIQWISSNQPTIKFSLSPSSFVEISSTPETVTSEVSFIEPNSKPISIEDDKEEDFEHENEDVD